MKKKMILGALFCTLCMTGEAMAALIPPGPTFYFDFDGDAAADTNLTINQGDIFTADIYVNNIGDYYDGIAGFGVNVSYDAAMVQVTSATVEAGWEFAGAPASPGLVELSGAMWMFGRFDDPLPAASIELQNLAAGTFTLSMADPGLATDSLAAFMGLDLYSYDSSTANPVVFQSAMVQTLESGTPAAVPVPGTMLLFGSGVLGLIGLRRKSS